MPLRVRELVWDDRNEEHIARHHVAPGEVEEVCLSDPRVLRGRGGTKRRISTFHTIEEEAEFWDTHSPLDYPESFKEVRIKVERPLEHLLGVRLDAKTITRLAEIARAKGIGASTLARIWIMERMSKEIEQEGVERHPSERLATPS